MKLFSKLMLVAVPALAVVAVLAVTPGNAKAADSQSSNNKSQSQNKQPNTNNKSSDVYKYVAQPGDSYTLMARKAVQDYNKSNKSNLSQAQIIYAETNLTQSAGSPYLEVGQSVSIKKSDVQKWVDSAKKLSNADQSAWGQYVSSVNFDTSGVGVSK